MTDAAVLDADQRAIVEKTATPSRLGKAIARDMWAERYLVDPWMLYFEAKVLPAVTANPLLTMSDEEWERMEDAYENEDDTSEWDDVNQHFFRLHLPPQIGKTRYMTLLAFWILGMMPDTRIIFVTYSDDYSLERGREIRSMIESFGWMFGIELDPDKTSGSDFGLKGHRGGVLAVGIGSQITGRSGDVIIIDDIIKNIKEASSSATKRLHEREFDSTIRTRLQPGGTIILTNTRWAEDDLAGRLEEREARPSYNGDRFTTMNFPAIAEPPDHDDVELTPEEREQWRDIIGRVEGEPLKSRFWRGGPWEKSVFYRVRASTEDPMAFRSVYQQDPRAREGGMFPPKKWGRYRLSDLAEHGGDVYMDAMARVWDLAASEGSGDWSTGLKLGKGSDGLYYVLDVDRFRRDAGAVKERVKVIASIDSYSTRIRFEEERAGAGKTVVALYELELPGYNVAGRRAEGSKEDRAKPASTFQQLGQILIPHDDQEVSWVPAFISELSKVMGDGRRGKHDDQLDTLAYAVTELMSSGPIEALDSSGIDLTSEDELLTQLLGIMAY